MPDTEKNTDQPKPKPGGMKGLIGKLVIAVFMAGVIAGECAIAFFMIPSADDVASLAEARLAQKMQLAALGEDEDFPVVGKNPVVEVDLGEYSITHKQGATSLRIDLSLGATVLEDNVSEFETTIAKSKGRLRHLIIAEVRNAEMSDLNDADLGLIRRRILEKSNALFGKPLLQQVLVNEFSFIEQ